MKLSKITAAIAATAMAASVQAETISGGALDGVATDTGAAAAVSAIAVVGSTQLLDGLRSMQGIGAACTGNVNALCAPSLSSAELRSIITAGGIANPNGVQGGGTNLGTASGITGKGSNFTEHAANGVLDALRSFTSSGVIAGFACGQGAALAISNAQPNDAATLAAQSGPSVGFVHATELDGSVGFIKIDGVSPSALALASSNYPLVSNLASDPAVADAEVNGITVGTVTNVAGVASHAGSACAPLTTGNAAADANGGEI